MAIAYLNSTIKASGTSGSTTDAIDSTGAGLIVAMVTYWSSKTPAALTDSASNVWTLLGKQISSGLALEWWYCIDPITSATHTFSHTGSFIYSAVAVSLYSGTGIAFDQSSINGGISSNTISPGSLTPANDNSLLVTSFGADNAGTQSVDSSFIERQNIVKSTGANYATAIADLIQTTAVAVNPTWTGTYSGYKAAGQAVFYESGPPPAPQTPLIIDTGVIQQLQSIDYLEGYTTNAADLTPDNAIILADGGVNGVQVSTALIADTGALTLAATASLETSGAHLPAFSIEDSAGANFFELAAHTQASGNVGIGSLSLPAITTGLNNICLGVQSGKVMTTGSDNVCVGVGSGIAMVGAIENLCLGSDAGQGITSSIRNVCIGYSAAPSITTNGGNTIIGASAYTNGTGYTNTHLGWRAGATATTGNSNVYIGSYAGFNASQLATAGNSVCIGANTYTTKSNQVVIGGSPVTETLLQGNIAVDNALVSPNWQSMDSGIFMRDVTTAPAGNPTGGGFLYVEAGALKFRGSGGTVTTIAPA